MTVRGVGWRGVVLRAGAAGKFEEKTDGKGARSKSRRPQHDASRRMKSLAHAGYDDCYVVGLFGCAGPLFGGGY